MSKKLGKSLVVSAGRYAQLSSTLTKRIVIERIDTKLVTIRGLLVKGRNKTKQLLRLNTQQAIQFFCLA